MTNKVIDRAHVTRAWLHSHEEDTASTTVYRPGTFAFPPSRGRKGFDLRTDGSLAGQKPGPTDQTVNTVGTWQLNGDRLELTPRGDVKQTLQIESLTPDRLVVKKGAQ